LLVYMNIHYKEITYSLDTDLQIHIFNIRTTRDTHLFFDEKKTLLRDVNYLFKQVFQKKYHYYSNCIIDINNDERKNINLTKEKAILAVERVLFFDKPYEFGYINAYERMIIHSYLKNRKDILTESFGEELQRRLVIRKTNS